MLRLSDGTKTATGTLLASRTTLPCALPPLDLCALAPLPTPSSRPCERRSVPRTRTRCSRVPALSPESLGPFPGRLAPVASSTGIPLSFDSGVGSRALLALAFTKGLILRHVWLRVGVVCLSRRPLHRSRSYARHGEAHPRLNLPLTTLRRYGPGARRNTTFLVLSSSIPLSLSFFDSNSFTAVAVSATSVSVSSGSNIRRAPKDVTCVPGPRLDFSLMRYVSRPAHHVG